MEVPEYTFDEFMEISLIRLRKENIEECTAKFIAEQVWNEFGSRDIWDVIKVARLASSIEEIPFVVRMLNRKYKFGGVNNN